MTGLFLALALATAFALGFLSCLGAVVALLFAMRCAEDREDAAESELIEALKAAASASAARAAALRAGRSPTTDRAPTPGI